jgi:hypothetical protein
VNLSFVRHKAKLTAVEYHFGPLRHRIHASFDCLEGLFIWHNSIESEADPSVQRGGREQLNERHHHESVLTDGRYEQHFTVQYPMRLTPIFPTSIFEVEPPSFEVFWAIELKLCYTVCLES